MEQAQVFIDSLLEEKIQTTKSIEVGGHIQFSMKLRVANKRRLKEKSFLTVCSGSCGREHLILVIYENTLNFAAVKKSFNEHIYICFAFMMTRLGRLP